MKTQLNQKARKNAKLKLKLISLEEELSKVVGSQANQPLKKVMSQQYDIVLELKEVLEEKLELINASLKSENPECPPLAQFQPKYRVNPASTSHNLRLPRKFCQKDFVLRHHSQIGDEPHELKQRLIGAFRKLDNIQAVCENLRFGLHRGFSDRPWFCAIFSLDKTDYDFQVKSSKNPPLHSLLQYNFASNYKLVLIHYKWTSPAAFKKTIRAIDEFELRITSNESCIAHSVHNNLSAFK